MNLEQMKELYATDQWICIVFTQFTTKKWSVDENPRFTNHELIYKLIHRKHSHILDAYLNDCEVYCYSKGHYNNVRHSFSKI